MTSVTVEYEGSVATVRYDRGGKANALNGEAIGALTDVADALSRNDDVHVVMLTGTDSRFSAGVDLDDPALWQPEADPVVRARAMAAGGTMCERWARLPQVTIAAIEGPAIGGGGILAMAADFRVMADDAYFRFPEVRLGMTLGWGGLPLLAGLVGGRVAKRLLFTDCRVDADEARRIGLCDRVTEKGQALAAARALAETVAGCPAPALRMTKRSLDAHTRANWAAGFESDQFYLSRILTEEKG